MYVKAFYVENARGNQMHNFIVMYVDGVDYFQSYSTVMGFIDADRTMHRTSNARTATTSRQLSCFFEQYAPHMTVKDFYKLPYERL